VKIGYDHRLRSFFTRLLIGWLAALRWRPSAGLLDKSDLSLPVNPDGSSTTAA